MPSQSARLILTGYMPVLHRGYLAYFQAYPEATEFYIFSNEQLKKVDYLRKDLRALSPQQQVKAVSGLGRFKTVEQLSAAKIKELDVAGTRIVMPDEDVSSEVAKQFKKAAIEFSPIFLRWDRKSVDANMADPNEVITAKELHRQLMRQAYNQSSKSSDIWRHVGAILVGKDGKEIGRSANQGEPTEHSPWMEGDPRNVYQQGVAIEISLFTHAEARLIAEAARDGIKLKGASLYVTTFPCPPCAKLIAHSGIKICYYGSGYAVLDGKRVMQEYGVKLFRVDGVVPKDDPDRLIPYENK